MATELKRFIIGRALRTEQAAHERLTKKTALAVFSSDAFSSTAYATEEILLVLAVAAAATQGQSFYYVLPSPLASRHCSLSSPSVIARRFTLILRAAARTSSRKKTSVQRPVCRRSVVAGRLCADCFGVDRGGRCRDHFCRAGNSFRLAHRSQSDPCASFSSPSSRSQTSVACANREHCLPRQLIFSSSVLS